MGPEVLEAVQGAGVEQLRRTACRSARLVLKSHTPCTGEGRLLSTLLPGAKEALRLP